MASSNLFDFNDFGPQQRSGVTPSTPGGNMFSTGFDPWRNQSGSAAPAEASTPGDAFGSSGTTTSDPAARRDTFGQLTASAMGTGTLTTAGPPLAWFGVAFALAIVGVALAGISALTGPMIATALGGWLLAGPFAIGALAIFSRVDTRRRTEAVYSAPTWTSTLYWGVLAVCLLGIAVGAWQIALWAGTM
ncbi:hypothetical protein A4G26_19940 [Mycobacterium kansasii]|uniref:Uncharacterized protein n=1 Tax=Mycobacterium innocens TaxID=2341083 RepID=A0A498QNK5_9MYCO|nr:MULTISPECIES: hypothetical protein [Mycobacterium]KZS51724.1 hypothetical protein A4G26_19940 [Mycobacterium kansasii]VBA45795.1 hypothetical protein LAUMK13_05531 [Mycobacterium innocens]